MCNVNRSALVAGAGHARDALPVGTAHGRDASFARTAHGHGPLIQQQPQAVSGIAPQTCRRGKQISPHRYIRGFTLLEVLVALVVLAVALVALTRTASNETEAFDALRQRSLAGWVAANALTDLRLQPGLPATGRNDGSARLAGRQWPWRMEVKATPSPGIRRLHVSVYEPGDDPARGATPVWVMDGFDSDQLEP